MLGEVGGFNVRGQGLNIHASTAFSGMEAGPRHADVVVFATKCHNLKCLGFRGFRV